MNKVKQPSKRKLTSYERLKKRILKEFPKKKFIGDISIKDSEYEILIEYFKRKCDILKNSNTHIINDVIFATALVQIGIKYYDGNFWRHVTEVFGTEKINPIYQTWIGQSFIHTLSLNKKILLDGSERVNNILMHGFVSDHYANEMFDFLFKYYNIDLERDLQRNNSEMMNGLIEVAERNDNTGRTYLLVKQTANAIIANTRGGKIRIRRILRLIDNCFWKQLTPSNPISRLTVLFCKWQENSNEFKFQYNKYNCGSVNAEGKKSFSSPYIICNFLNTTFKLVLPSQLIKFEFENNVRWNIINQEHEKIILTSLYQAVTGYKTDEKEFSINAEDIFNEFIIKLICSDKIIRLFKINADCIRFFDKDGDYLNSTTSLPEGDVYAFTKENQTPISEALIENEPIGKLLRSYFKFEYGDIVRLPDGKPVSIGKKLEEGLQHRKVLKASYAINNGVIIPIYSAPPIILIKTLAKRANGTLIEINSNRFRLFDKQTTVIELKDRSGETGYLLNLSDYGCTQDGVYTIIVDVPNDNTNRFWKFVLISGISCEFEDAPYIFKSKGTIRFNEGLVIKSQESKIIKNNDENSFNFSMEPDIDDLKFVFNTKDEAINLSFDIPVLKWKFDRGLWNVEKPSDIWHSDFPQAIYFKYPDDKIKISMEEQIEDDNDLEEQAVTYFKSKSKGIFECDTTRFKSWFSRDKVARNIYFQFCKNRTEFIRVITRSFIVSHMLKGDFESGKLKGEFDIIGNANYYVDVKMREKECVLAEKLPVIHGKFDLESTLSSGLYRVNIFEDEEDDTGFGVTNYLPIGEFEHNLINPYDLDGKTIVIRHIKKTDSLFQIQLNSKYVVSDLKRVEESNKHNYVGKLLVKTVSGYRIIAYNVNVEFFDLDKLQYVYLTYYDEYDFVEFLYDTNKKAIVKEEEKGLKRAARYRRYDSLYAEDYLYVVQFSEEILNIIQELSVKITKDVGNQILWKQKDKSYTTIEEMRLSVRTYNCLKRAKIYTANDIQERGTQALLKVRNLGYRGINEIISKMQGLGFIMEDIKHIETNSTK